MNRWECFATNISKEKNWGKVLNNYQHHKNLRYGFSASVFKTGEVMKSPTCLSWRPLAWTGDFAPHRGQTERSGWRIRQWEKAVWKENIPSPDNPQHPQDRAIEPRGGAMGWWGCPCNSFIELMAWVRHHLWPAGICQVCAADAASCFLCAVMWRLEATLAPSRERIDGFNWVIGLRAEWASNLIKR